MKTTLFSIVLVFVFGCVTVIGRVSTATYDPPKRGGTFYFYVDESQVTLTEKKLQECISEKMCALGFKESNNLDEADYVLFYSYNIGQGRMSVESHPDFVWGGHAVSSSTTYPRFFQISLVDRVATIKANKPVFVWQGEVYSSGSSSNMSWLGEYFIDQIFKNYGKDVDNKTFVIPMTYSYIKDSVASLAPAPAPEPAPVPKPAASGPTVGPVVGTTLITVREITVFSGPSSTYDQLGSLKEGCKIQVRESKGGWCRISCKEYSVAWIQVTYLIGARLEPERPKVGGGPIPPAVTAPVVTAPTVAAPVVPEPVVISPAVTGIDKVTLTKKAPVRASPGTIYAPVGVIPSGVTLTVLEERKGWYRFSTELFPTGWIEKECTDRAEPKTYRGGKGR